MNVSVIRHTVGSVITLVAVFMAVPLVCALLLGESTAVSFAIPAVVALAVGLLLQRGPLAGSMGIHEAYIIVTGAWCLAAVAGAAPFFLSGVLASPIDAVFESMSGITTTGSTVLTDLEALPRSILMWRALLNWLGGLGIIVLFVAVVPRLGVEGNQLFKTEMPGPTAEKLRPRIRESGRLLWVLYVLLTLALAGVLWTAGIPWFEAIVHAFSTVSTGGSSTLNQSVGAFANPWAEWIIALFMFLGATNFALLYRCIRRGEFGLLAKNGEFQAYLGVVLGASALIALDLVREGRAPFVDAARAAVFQVVSVVSTTGFTSSGDTAWTPAAATVLFFLMFTSGMAGSTAGGPKMIRTVIAVKHGFLGMLRLLHPRSVAHLRLGELKISEQMTLAVGGFLVLYLLVFAFSCILLSFAGLDLVTAAAVAISSLGNIGQGFGLAGPYESYASAPGWVKLYLSLLMLVGRLELYSVVVLFQPSFWSRK